VALARALVIEPSILLLDEPLGAIDLKLRKQMQLELKALNRTLGITFIYVTHDQEEALTLSDRIAVMDHGEVVQIGGPAEIYESPRSAFVAEFIGESNFLSGTALTEQNGLWTIGRDDLEFRIPAQPGIATGSSVTVAVRPEWLRVCPPGQAPSKANMIPATVREVVYLGETLQVVAQVTATGQAMRVTVPNEGQLKNPIAWKTGDEIVLTWLPGDSQVLEENSS
jgi:spermidine/putrescine transport system ATP-binding protein